MKRLLILPQVWLLGLTLLILFGSKVFPRLFTKIPPALCPAALIGGGVLFLAGFVLGRRT